MQNEYTKNLTMLDKLTGDKGCILVVVLVVGRYLYMTLFFAGGLIKVYLWKPFALKVEYSNLVDWKHKYMRKENM